MGMAILSFECLDSKVEPIECLGERLRMFGTFGIFEIGRIIIYFLTCDIENTMTHGYTSEKIYSGLMADTIPIYFGNLDIAQIVNPNRIIVCQVDDDFIVDTRQQFGKTINELKVSVNIGKKDDWHANKTQTALLENATKEWAIRTFEPYLRPCLDEMIAVDTNDTLYKWKLKQPAIPNNSFENSHYDGTVVVKSIIDTLRYL